MINKLTTHGTRARAALVRSLRRGWLAGGVSLALIGSGGLRLAQSQGTPKFSEHEVKAAFLFNFMQFVEWPASVTTNVSTPLVIGVLGDNPFGTVLDETIKGETVRGQPLQIKRSHRVDDLKDCQIVFICHSEKAHLKEILNALRGCGILTVSDIEQFCQHGGMIELLNEGGKIRFAINQEAAEQDKVKISSKLLRLARLANK